MSDSIFVMSGFTQFSSQLSRKTIMKYDWDTKVSSFAHIKLGIGEFNEGLIDNADHGAITNNLLTFVTKLSSVSEDISKVYLITMGIDDFSAKCAFSIYQSNSVEVVDFTSMNTKTI